MIAEPIPLDAYRDIEAEMVSVVEREHVRSGSSQQQRRVDARVVWADQIGASFLEVNWLAKGLIEVGSLALVYGPPKSGKTFIATDLALHIATGREWMGCRVRLNSLVVYVAHEGTPGVMRRILAHTRHHNLQKNALKRLAIVSFSLNLLDRKCVEEFVAFIRQIESERGDRVSLIVIDTLARSMAGADENTAKDMGAAIGGADSVRNATGAAVMLIHHSGKDDERGPRGSSALNGAVDSSFVVHRDKESGSATISADLQRDGDASFIAGFRLVPIVLAKDRDGDDIVSMAVEPTEAAEMKAACPRLSDGARFALNVLADLIARAGEVAPATGNIPPGTIAVTESAWRSALDQRSPDDTADAKRKRMSRAATTLIAKGRIAMSAGLVWLCGTGARP